VSQYSRKCPVFIPKSFYYSESFIPSVSEILQPTTLTNENELKTTQKNRQVKAEVGKALSIMATV
jgi:hypothetical protein